MIPLNLLYTHVRLQYFNVDGIRDSIPAIHWAQVAHTCARTVSPLCTAVRKTLHDDVEHLVQLFSELEAAYATELQANDEVRLLPK